MVHLSKFSCPRSDVCAKLAKFSKDDHPEAVQKQDFFRSYDPESWIPELETGIFEYVVPRCGSILFYNSLCNFDHST